MSYHVRKPNLTEYLFLAFVKNQSYTQWDRKYYFQVRENEEWEVSLLRGFQRLYNLQTKLRTLPQGLEAKH